MRNALYEEILKVLRQASEGDITDKVRATAAHLAPKIRTHMGGRKQVVGDLFKAYVMMHDIGKGETPGSGECRALMLSSIQGITIEEFDKQMGLSIGKALEPLLRNHWVETALMEMTGTNNAEEAFERINGWRKHHELDADGNG
jgi:hypothetical protein